MRASDRVLEDAPEDHSAEKINDLFAPIAGELRDRYPELYKRVDAFVATHVPRRCENCGEAVPRTSSFRRFCNQWCATLARRKRAALR